MKTETDWQVEAYNENAIIKGNKLIAEFMGMTYGDPNDNSVMIQITPQGNEVVPIQSMEYHESWDWLMPVVEKIEEFTIEDDNLDLAMRTHRFSIETNLGLCEIYDNIYDKVIGSGDYGNKLESTYHAIIEFIEWYNKNKS